MNTYYTVLGVNENVSQNDLRAAYRQKMAYWHPDKWTTKEASERIKAGEESVLLNEANDVLSNPLIREEYDAELEKLRSPNFYTPPTPPTPPPPSIRDYFCIQCGVHVRTSNMTYPPHNFCGTTCYTASHPAIFHGQQPPPSEREWVFVLILALVSALVRFLLRGF